ncbi:hypothetical protein C0Q92_16735 [Streptomyces albidoflavus]|uniref:Uncharacterized protein n=1 Tax=Streptomyces albidoflavus TaxID=1886 RepID=A0A8G1ZS66_9ACTN|nr:hypothetical protein C0Q92_16735 [Streptomyces albidoflavus]RZE42739.1 hypothetical protein C0Q95_15810 [Streptomyces albidoflavus]
MRSALAAPGGSWYASGDRTARDPTRDPRPLTTTKPHPYSAPLPLRERAGVWGRAPGGSLYGCCAPGPAGPTASGAETGAGGGPAGPERARPATAGRLDQVKKL